MIPAPTRPFRRGGSMRGRCVAALALLAGSAAIAALSARAASPQEDPAQRVAWDSAADWGSPAARELVARAITRRAEWTGDDDLRDYQAHARGHIYFLFDLGRGTARHLVKADQLALNLFWLAPGRTRQTIVGRREERVLPTRIEYHIDHLTVVMDNFDDRIRLGEGSEVRDVLHPAAPGALEFYEYRIADSLALALPDRRVRVYRVDVRPRDPGSAAFVGSVFLDRETADIVRMEFTFTAAAYLDDQLDYINVRLENGLWEGRYWLPHRQGLELRREVRALDFPAGGIIRAEFRIGDYRFDTGFPPGVVEGPSVVRLPARARSGFEFDEGLYDALDPRIATAPPSLEEVRDEASRMVAQSYLRRAEDFRLAVPGISSIVRFRRGEGLYTGPGLSRDFPNAVALRLLAGRAWGGDRWELEGRVRAEAANGLAVELNGHYNRSAEVAPWPASSGVTSTMSALLEGEDYREPYWSTGGSLMFRRPLGGVAVAAGAFWEEWEPASLAAADVLERGYRAVRELDEGEAAGLRLEAEMGSEGALYAVGGGGAELRLEGASAAIGGDFEYVRAAARGERVWAIRSARASLRLSLEGGTLLGGRPPAQRLFPLGGRGTVRGYPFHAYVGDLYARGGVEATREIWHPFVTGAAFVDVGWAGVEGGAGAERALGIWNRRGDPARGTPGWIAGAGLGVGLVFDIVRVELAHGLDDAGTWELVIRASERFWRWL